MSEPLFPALYEINTRIWLGELSKALGRSVTLNDVADDALDRLAGLGFDWVWLMGVWQTGPAGCAVSRSIPEWRREYAAILPDLTDADIRGSPFAVAGYSVHRDFGGNEALLHLHARLRQRGLRLLLDFVPNHTALDHPWAQDRPEYYVQAGDEDLAREPYNYCRVDTVKGPVVMAHGRDPYFPGWPDTLQLNYRHSGCRQAMKAELTAVAGLCDGVRCDMAMLLLPDVFNRTWGQRSVPRDGSAPVDRPFWPEAIAAVRAARPDFLFMAEAYWDLEWALQQQGFAYTYDKRLYDRLHARDAAAVRGHLHADVDFQRRSVRFLENHDEPRAASALPANVHAAAAAVAYLVPGLRFFHDGQLEGRKVKISVHLGRRPEEPIDPALRDYYARLLDVLKRPELRGGNWQLVDCRPAWDGNSTWGSFIAFLWQGSEARLLVTVNYGPSRGQCYAGLPSEGLDGNTFLFRDLMSPAIYKRKGDDLAARGLYLDMPAWGYHVLEVTGVE